MYKSNIIAFPHMANYNIPLKTMFESILNCKILSVPPITKKTLDIGSKYSPDFVCVPFKYNLGNFIEALDKGANTIIQAGGGCRFGYYAELQEKILIDLGYDFKFLNLFAGGNAKIRNTYKELKNINPKLNVFKGIYHLSLTISKIYFMDYIEDYIRKNRCYEIKKDSFNKLHKEFLDNIGKISRYYKFIKFKHKYKKLFKQIPIEKSNNNIRVGIVGELYTLMEPFANGNIEQTLNDMGIEVTRYVTMSYLVLDKAQRESILLKKKNKYVKYALGAGGTDSVIKSISMAKENYDGIIHMKSFGCTPEVSAMPILQNISNDYGIPIIYLSFDSETSETGLQTRLEAFHDMLKMKGKNINEKSIFRS